MATVTTYLLVLFCRFISVIMFLLLSCTCRRITRVADKSFADKSSRDKSLTRAPWLKAARVLRKWNGRTRCILYIHTVHCSNDFLMVNDVNFWYEFYCQVSKPVKLILLCRSWNGMGEGSTDLTQTRKFVVQYLFVCPFAPCCIEWNLSFSSLEVSVRNIDWCAMNERKKKLDVDYS